MSLKKLVEETAALEAELKKVDKIASKTRNISAGAKYIKAVELFRKASEGTLSQGKVEVIKKANAKALSGLLKYLSEQ